MVFLRLVDLCFQMVSIVVVRVCKCGINLNLGMWAEKITGLEKRLQWLERQQDTRDNDTEILETRKALNIYIDAESNIWNQDSRNIWLTGGNRNTRFFPEKASNRKQRNTIKGLVDEVATW